MIKKTKVFNKKTITIRGIEKNDLKRAKEFQNFINSLIKEDAQILLNKKLTIKQETEWLKEQLKQVKDKKKVFLIAECKNEIIGNSSIELQRGRQMHVGDFSISIKNGYRGIGLGKYLLNGIIKLAKKELKPKILKLAVFPNNKPAINLYKKFGFQKVAKIPKQLNYKGKLIDEIIMILEL